MLETYLNEENEIKHTEENYVRVVPSVMGLLTLPDGRRVQRLSESHYLKKNLKRLTDSYCMRFREAISKKVSLT